MAGPERSSFAAKMSLLTDRSARRRSGDRHRGSAASVAHTEPADERAIVVEVLAGSEAEGRVPRRSRRRSREQRELRAAGFEPGGRAAGDLDQRAAGGFSFAPAA